MPYFLDPHMYNWGSSELWVGVGLLLFFAVVIAAGAPKLVARTLDAKAAKIQADLDEAARLRAEAEALLAQIRREKAEAEAQAAQMLAAAEQDARRLEAEAKTRLEESLARRQAVAEQRIAQAEAQAATDVKAAAAEAASATAERVLRARLEAGAPDPLLNAAIADMGARLN